MGGRWTEIWRLPMRDRRRVGKHFLWIARRWLFWGQGGLRDFVVVVVNCANRDDVKCQQLDLNIKLSLYFNNKIME